MIIWDNHTGYDDEGLQHVMQRVIRAAEQAWESETYEDESSPMPEIDSAHIVYGDRIRVDFTEGALKVTLPRPIKLWPELESLHRMTNDTVQVIPEAHVAELVDMLFEVLCPADALYHMMKLIIPGSMSWKELRRAWFDMNIRPCCSVTIRTQED